MALQHEASSQRLGHDYSSKVGEIQDGEGHARPDRILSDMRCVVHGDDFTFLGWQKDSDEAVAFLKRHSVLIVTVVLGGDEPDWGDLVTLNRRSSWTGNEMRYDADERQAKRVIDEMGVGQGPKGLDKPLVREAGGQDDGEISTSEATRFRALVATANCLAADRRDMQFGVKEICREMAAPAGSTMARLNVLARYLAESGSCVATANSRNR